LKQGDSGESRLKEKLKELQQFVLNRKSENVRNDLYDFLVLRALSDHTQDGGTGLSSLQIRELLEKDFKISKCPVIHLESALARLHLNNEISMKKNETYTLFSEKRKRIEEDARKYHELSLTVSSQLKERIAKRAPELTEMQLSSVVDNIFKLLGSVLAHYGVLSAKVLGGDGGMVKTLKNYPGFQEMYHRLVSPSLPQKWKKEVEAEFSDFFFNPSPELSRFFFAMAQSYVLIEVLNVDPELKQIEHATWSSKRIYLDTNIVLDILFRGDPAHKWAMTVIDATKELGAKMFVSQRTKAEVDKWLHDRKSATRKYLASPPALQQALAEQFKIDVYYSSFKAEEEESGQGIEGFTIKYDNYLDILSNKFGIKLDPRAFDVKDDVPPYSNLMRVVKNITPGKSGNVAEHDASSIIAIHEMRKSESFDEAGPSAWFLTSDASLYYVEMQNFGTDIIPASITIDAWLQLISPFVSPTALSSDAATAFTQLLGTSLVTANVFPRGIGDLLSVFMDDKEFSAEQFRRIIGDVHVRNSLSKLKRGLETGEDESKLAEYARPMVEGIKKELKAEYDEKLNSLQKSYGGEISKALLELEEERKSASTERGKHASEIAKIKTEVDNLGETLVKERKQRKKIDRQSRIYRTWIALIVGSAVLDTVLALVLAYYFSDVGIAVSAGIVGAAMAIETGIIVEAPKLMEYFSKKDEDLAG
jgi:hypothetical protein